MWSRCTTRARPPSRRSHLMCQVPFVARVGDAQLIVAKTRSHHQVCRLAAAHLQRPVMPLSIAMSRADVGTSQWIAGIAASLGAVSTLSTPHGAVYLVPPPAGPMPDHAAVAKIAARAARDLVRERRGQQGVRLAA